MLYAGPFSSLGLWLEEEGYDAAEKDGGSDTARGSCDPTGEGAQQAIFSDRLFYPFGEQLTEAGEWNGGAGAAEVDDVLVDAQTAQYHPGDHIEHQDLGGGQLGPVDEDLSDEAKGPSAEEGTQIGEKSIHFYTPFSVEMATA
mgnify:CR=1 FL=1